MRNDFIVMSLLKIAQQFFVCEYFLLIPIDVPSFKLIEGQLKELQGGTKHPRAENDQKSLGIIGLNINIESGENLPPPCISSMCLKARV